MGRLLVSLLLFFSWSHHLSAQVYKPLPQIQEPGLVTIGLRTGVGLTTLVGHDALDSLSTGGSPNYKTGLIVGLNVTSQLRPAFWLQHELWVQQQGAIIQLLDENSQVYSSRLRMTYLTLFPANLTFIRKNVHLYVGPYIGMALAASIQRKDKAGNLQSDPSVFATATSLKGYISKIDAGLTVGIDYVLAIRWTVGLKMQRGLIPVWNENTLIQTGQTRIYNQGATFTIGYQISN